MYKLEDLISEFGEIPVCGCDECQNKKIKINIKPDKYGSFYWYKKRHGYPKYTRGHHARGKGNPGYGIHKFGNDNPNFGNHMSKENKEKLRQIHLGKSPSQKVRNKIGNTISELWKNVEYRESHSGENHHNYNKSPWNKGLKGYNSGENHPMFGKHHTEETRLKQSKNCRDISKDKNPNWQGGITQLKSLIRNCNLYFEWRYQVYKRDNYTCQDCHKVGGNLEAHHKKQLSLLIYEFNIKTLEQALNCSELWNISNGKTLCEDCHNKYQKILYIQNSK